MNNIVKVSFSKCPIQNRKNVFLNSSCIMPISVGQNLQVHEGQKFSATIKLTNSSFKKCTLLIDDTIQRHTLKIFNPENEKELIARCLSEGDAWLVRNKPIYTMLNIDYNILRWNDWLHHPQYESKKNTITELYQQNFVYQEAINSTIHEYLTRIKNRETVNFNESHAFNCCLEYLLEECAVMYLWAHEEYDFELYPTGRNLAMKAAYELAIQEEYPDKLVSVSLHFRKTPAKIAT